MRICMIGNARAVHLQRWARAYADAGHSVDILSVRSAAVAGARVHTVSLGPSNSAHVIWVFLSYVKLALFVRRTVRSLRPDVVNPHYVTTNGTLARLAGMHPIVLTAWGSDVIPADGVRQPWPIRWCNRWALRGADRTTATSGYLARWVQRAGGDDPKLVPFGVDVNEFRPAQARVETRPFTIGAVKALQLKYGHRFLIEAFAVLRRSVPTARLVLAGRGPERSRLEALAVTLGVDDHVEFRGPVDHRNVPALMLELDVLVNPTVVPEAFGVVILEGSACGLPVVATDVGGVPDVCIDGVTGVLVPPRDPAALAGALSALATDRRLRQSLGTAGRRFVEERFDWQDSVASMVSVIGSSRGKP